MNLEHAQRVVDLVSAVRAELTDLLDDVSDAKGNLFSDAGKRALERMRRVNELLTLIERRAA